MEQRCPRCGAFQEVGWISCRECAFTTRPMPPPGSSPAGALPGWVIPVLAAVALLAVGAVGLLLLGQGDDGGSAVGPTTTEDPDATTDEGPTAAEYAAALRSANERNVTLSDDAWTCTGSLVVTTFGGPEGLEDLGVDPGRMVSGRWVDASDVPDGAFDAIAAGLPACGVDFGMVMYDQLVETAAPVPELLACLRSTLDQGIASRNLAALLLGEPLSTPARQAYLTHSREVAEACA